MKRVAAMAERSGCAVILIGHMNKAQGLKAGYRGLGSIDFRAAARSVLLVGRTKDDPSVRIMAQPYFAVAAFAASEMAIKIMDAARRIH